MRRIFSWTLVLLACAQAHAEFGGDLLAYDELIALSSAKRAQYLVDVRALAVVMEEQDEQYEVSAADASRLEFNEGIATLLQGLSVMPEAQATDAPAPPVKNESCELPHFACAKLDAKAKGALEAKFRADHSPGSNACVSGGFFSFYADSSKRKGTCHIVREFPPSSKTAGTKCDNGQAMCNPWLFCVYSEVNEQKVPVSFCVDSGKKFGNNVTAACNRTYAAQEGQAVSAHPEFKKHLCQDPSEIAAPMKEPWEEFVKATRQKYQHFCVKDANFQGLFCQDCQVMAGRIHAINMAATGSGCAKTPAKTAPLKSGAPGAVTR